MASGPDSTAELRRRRRAHHPVAIRSKTSRRASFGVDGPGIPASLLCPSLVCLCRPDAGRQRIDAEFRKTSRAFDRDVYRTAHHSENLLQDRSQAGTQSQVQSDRQRPENPAIFNRRAADPGGTVIRHYPVTRARPRRLAPYSNAMELTLTFQTPNHVVRMLTYA